MKKKYLNVTDGWGKKYHNNMKKEARSGCNERQHEYEEFLIIDSVYISLNGDREEEKSNALRQD